MVIYLILRSKLLITHSNTKLICHLLKLCIFFIIKTTFDDHNTYIAHLIEESKNIYVYFEQYLDHTTITKYLSAINYLIDINDDTHTPTDPPQETLDATNEIITTFSLL